MKATLKSAPPQAAFESFFGLTVADLMTTPVMTIPQETSLREAARLLTGCHISGAPIVDGDGRCLGVLSSSDFITVAGKDEKGAKEASPKTCFISPWGEMIDIDESQDSEIRRYMKAPLVTVTPATLVGECARQMVDAHIHRVLVLAEDDRPCGIVSSTDILAAVSRAASRR